VVRHIFQACPVWIYTQSNITQAYLKAMLHGAIFLATCNAILPLREVN
jgi:hypothetical protein